MASIIVRNLELSLKSQLRLRAAHNGRSMEDEARHILRAALGDGNQPASAHHLAIISAKPIRAAAAADAGPINLPQPQAQQPAARDPLEFD